VKLSEHNLSLRDSSHATLSHKTSLQIMRETLTEANGRANGNVNGNGNGQVDPAQQQQALRTVEISDASRSSNDSSVANKPGLHFKQFRQYTTGAESTATTAFCGVLRHTASDRHISYSPSGACLS
jgi:hypothetical protein